MVAVAVAVAVERRGGVVGPGAEGLQVGLRARRVLPRRAVRVQWGDGRAGVSGGGGGGAGPAGGLGSVRAVEGPVVDGRF